MLRTRDTRRLPFKLEQGAWDDVEQGWWATVIPVGRWVFLAEADFDALVDAVREPKNMARSNPGFVTVDGVDIRWARVEKDAYERAWDRAAARFSAAG
jgi:hypothetical protein